MRSRPHITLPLTLALAFCAGCSIATADKEVGRPTAGPQLIVKFKAGTLDCSEAGIQKLSGLAGHRLRLVRPMSGDACVIRLQDGTDPAATGAALSAIRALPAVQYAEPDAVMRAS